MSVVIKYKLSDVAKDLNVQNKELIDFLYQTLGESKKHTSPLTEAELNHVFEHYTQKNSEASLDAYLASAPAPKVAEKDILKKADGTVVAAGPAKRKERIRPAQAAGLLAAFAGALLIIKPSFFHMEYVPALIGALGGLGAGAAYTYVRKMGLNGETGTRIVFYFSLFSCAVTLPMFLAAGQPMTPAQFLILLAAGLCGAGGQFSITRAYYYAPAREISVYDYCQVLFAALWGFFLFGQVPDLMSLLGYAVITGAAILMYLYNNRLWLFRGKSEAPLS